MLHHLCVQGKDEPTASSLHIRTKELKRYWKLLEKSFNCKSLVKVLETSGTTNSIVKMVVLISFLPKVCDTIAWRLQPAKCGQGDAEKRTHVLLWNQARDQKGSPLSRWKVPQIEILQSSRNWKIDYLCIYYCTDEYLSGPNAYTPNVVKETPQYRFE